MLAVTPRSFPSGQDNLSDYSDWREKWAVNSEGGAA